MEIKEYMIDDTPVTFKELVQAARDVDRDFDESGFYQTSVAAGILRRKGHTVYRNNNIK